MPQDPSPASPDAPLQLKCLFQGMKFPSDGRNLRFGYRPCPCARRDPSPAPPCLFFPAFHGSPVCSQGFGEGGLKVGKDQLGKAAPVFFGSSPWLLLLHRFCCPFVIPAGKGPYRDVRFIISPFPLFFIPNLETIPERAVYTLEIRRFLFVSVFFFLFFLFLPAF